MVCLLGKLEKLNQTSPDCRPITSEVYVRSVDVLFIPMIAASVISSVANAILYLLVRLRDAGFERAYPETSALSV